MPARFFRQERTSCPAAARSAFTATGSGDDCYTRQLAACQLLKKPVAQGGAGIVHVNDSEADGALNDCETSGLSPLMRDYIYAYRGDDPSYINALTSQMTPANLENQIAQMQVEKAQFNKRLADEKEALSVAIGVTIQEEINWKLKKQNEQVAEQTRILAEQTKLMTEQNKILSQILAKQQPILADR